MRLYQKIEELFDLLCKRIFSRPY